MFRRMLVAYDGSEGAEAALGALRPRRAEQVGPAGGVRGAANRVPWDPLY